MKALGGVHSYVAHSGLAKKLVDLVYPARVADQRLLDMHSRDLLKEGLTVDKLVTVPVGAKPVICSRNSTALDI